MNPILGSILVFFVGAMVLFSALVILLIAIIYDLAQIVIPNI